ncbi:MAG: tetratricopeptide repeat protein [Gammaproteobacteria bacterium]|nr:MAG: tetratricopeptide repeat protein [Gammaproteobacteria bacterium]
MNNRTLPCAVLLLVITLVGTSCTSTKAKQDIACTKKILSVIEISKNATVAYDQGDYELAEKLYKDVVNADPDNLRALYKLGNIYSNTERPIAAINAYHKVLEFNPEHKLARHNLGVVYLEQSQKYLQYSRGSSEVFEDVLTSELKKYLQQLLEQM